MIQLEFRGTTYEKEYDQERLTKQWMRVYNLMMDGEWRTLREIANVTEDPESSISARLRDLRNEFGYTVERRRRGWEGRGIFEYRLDTGKINL